MSDGNKRWQNNALSDDPTAKAPSSTQRLGINRRLLVAGLFTTTLSGCVSMQGTSPVATARSYAPDTPSIYAALHDGGFAVPGVDTSRVDEKYWRRTVRYETSEPPGTLIVDTPSRYLYHVTPGGWATRYGVGIGREGFEWSGRAIVAYKRAWPRWTPPDSMIKRQPELKRYNASNGGMDPGLDNPLGARALYIHENGRDTLYRLHGTNEPGSVGQTVSSGCIRLLNQDAIHLAGAVAAGSSILVIPDSRRASLLFGSVMPANS